MKCLPAAPSKVPGHPAPTRRDLIFHQWWTRAGAATDDTGTITLRGFHGRYGVTAFVARARTSAPMMLPAGGAALTLTLPRRPLASATWR